MVFYPAMLHAQEPFQRTAGLSGYESVNCLLPLSDGYLAAGATNSAGAGKYDIMLMKTRLDFSTEWCKIYGGGENEYPHTLLACSDGGYLIVGRTESFGEGEEDALVIKLNASFDIEWKKTYGKDKTERAYSALETQTNGYLIVGTTQSGKGGLVFEIDLAGNLKWSKTYGFHESSFVCHNVLMTDDGNYLIDGPYESVGQSFNYLLIKIDPTGNLLWSKSYNADEDDKTSDIVKVPGNGYYILGRSTSFSNGSMDLLLVKTDLNGNFQWAKNYASTEDMWASQMLLTSDNELLLTCHTDLFKMNNDIVVLKCDLDGNLLWGKSYGEAGLDNMNFGNHRSTIEVHPNLFTIVGKTSNWGQGLEDVYFVGFDKEGESACNVYPYSVVVTNHALPTGNVPLPVETFDPVAKDPALILNDIILIDTLLCPHDQTPIALFSASNTILCAGDCIDFTDQSTNDPNFWDWSFEGAIPAVSSDTSPSNICYPNAGCFDVQLIVHNFAGSDTLLLEDYICVTQGPDFSLGSDTILCFGDSIPLNGPTGLPHYLWNTGSSDPEITINQTGEYWLEVEDNQGCSSTDTIYVEISNEIIVELGPDTALCTGDSLTLIAPSAYAGYFWSTGSSAPELIVKQAGEYWLEVEDNNGCSAADTILVDFRDQISINIGSDTTLCTGDSILLSAPPGFQSYYWQDGSTAEELLVKQEGAYWVEVSNDDGCSGSDTVYISFAALPDVNLGNDTLVCNGGILLEAGEGYDNYLWQDGSSFHDYPADTSGTYWVEVSNVTGCMDADTIIVETVEIPAVFLGNDTSFCKEISLLLDAGSNYDHYQWQDGSLSTTFLAEEAGVYWVQVDLKGCPDGDTLVIVEDCPTLIWFPNGFTPNGDGKNDEFKPVYDNVKEYSLFIYDRWGGLIFESKDVETGWVGKINGKPAPTGVYVFKASYRDVQKAVDESTSGVITLIR